jgi:GxxExxY protein
MIYEKETSLIRKGLFEIQNLVGLGHNEEAYHKAMVLWLKEQGIPHTSKAPHSLLFGREPAHILYPDLIVWDKITIELKAVARHLQNPERVQIFNYLKRRNDQLGLLVNMGMDRVHVERILYEPPAYQQTEDWKFWNHQISGSTRDIGFQIREVIQELYETHQTGYGTEVIEKLIQFGLNKTDLKFTPSPLGRSEFNGTSLGENPLDCILIENKIILIHSALFDSNQFNINRGRSFMKCLSIPWGIAVNFGKQNLDITGLSI